MKSDDDIRKILENRFSHCKTIDIKGFGISFPRELIIAVIEELTEIYPELKEYSDRTIGILNHIDVEMDNEIYRPSRGVGLGYFHQLMYIAVFAILQDQDIIASFADDTLIDIDDFDDAIQNLQEYDIPINFKKTGKEWKNFVWFINCGFDLQNDHIYEFTNKNALIAAIFNQRYHWERKLIGSLLPYEQQPIVGYCIERLFGKEFYRGEHLNHVHDGGMLSCIDEIIGTTRSKYACAEIRQHTKLLWQLGDLPKSLYDLEEKEIHKIRKSRWKSKNKLEFFDYYQQVIEPDIDNVNYDVPYSYPSHAERAMVQHGFSSKPKTYGESYEVVLNAMSDYPDEHDPVKLYKKNAEKVWSPRHKSDEERELFLREVNSDWVSKKLAFHSTISSPLQEVQEVVKVEPPRGLDFYINTNQSKTETVIVDGYESSNFEESESIGDLAYGSEYELSSDEQDSEDQESTEYSQSS